MHEVWGETPRDPSLTPTPHQMGALNPQVTMPSAEITKSSKWLFDVPVQTSDRPLLSSLPALREAVGGARAEHWVSMEVQRGLRPARSRPCILDTGGSMSRNVHSRRASISGGLEFLRVLGAAVGTDLIFSALETTGAGWVDSLLKK